MLTSLADPQNREAAGNDEELADDVASISYEPALRAQARVSRENCDALRDPETGGENQATPKFHSDALPSPPKTARFTIRLSETESVQLRQRAAEARMTVSEYLRSCVLEVESLRVEVKDVLAELRNSPPPPATRGTASNRGFATAFYRLRNWFRHIAPRRRPDIRLNPANPFAPIR